jgi:hypothetical protein
VDKRDAVPLPVRQTKIAVPERLFEVVQIFRRDALAELRKRA